MKKTTKLTSLILAMLMLISVFAIAPITASAVEKSPTTTRPVITDVVNSNPKNQVATNRYYFYMPDNWYNTKNDNYDGRSLDSCAAGIYWWSSSYNSDDYKGDNAQGWPGFLILNNLANVGQPNIFYCDVPVDAEKIIFNNTVDGGQDETAPGWGFNAQTVTIKTAYKSNNDDHYGFYTDMTPENPMTFNNMIYVVNPQDTEVNEFSGATTTYGDWFYLYDDYSYGITPQKGKTSFSNGDFPSSITISVRLNGTEIKTEEVSNHTFSVSYYLTAPKLITDGDLELNYDNSKLTLTSVTTPNITVGRTTSSKYSDNPFYIYFTGANQTTSSGLYNGLYNFKNGDVLLIAAFDVPIGVAGVANINLKIGELDGLENGKSTSYFTNGAPTTEGQTLLPSLYNPTIDQVSSSSPTSSSSNQTNPTFPSSNSQPTHPSSSESQPTLPTTSNDNENNSDIALVEQLIQEGKALSSDSDPNAYTWIISVLNFNEKYPDSSVYSVIKNEAEDAQNWSSISSFNNKNKILGYLAVLKDEISGNYMTDPASSETQPSQPSSSETKPTDPSSSETQPTQPSQPTQPTQPSQPTQPQKKDISGWKVMGLSSKTYTGKAITQKVIVTDGKEIATVKSTYTNNKNAGSATMVIVGKGDYTGTIVKTFKINKANNPMTVKAVNKTAKLKTVKKKNVAVTALTVKNAQGTKSFKKTSGNKNITVNAKTGKLTVKKGLKKSTYSIKIKVTAKGNANYKSASKTVTVKIKVK